jgi:hypothetical protein
MSKEGGVVFGTKNVGVGTRRDRGSEGRDVDEVEGIGIARKRGDPTGDGDGFGPRGGGGGGLFKPCCRSDEDDAVRK